MTYFPLDFPPLPCAIFLIVTPVGTAMWADVEKADDVRDYCRQFRDLAMNDERKKRFEKAAMQGDHRFFVEYLRFLSQNKKYWMIPIIVVLLLIGLLVILGGSVAGAFIYPIF